MSDTILAIDIGSTKICAIIAEIKDSEVTIQGHGITKSQGVKKGAITNIELASKSIKKAHRTTLRLIPFSLDPISFFPYTSFPFALYFWQEFWSR